MSGFRGLMNPDEVNALFSEFCEHGTRTLAGGLRAKRHQCPFCIDETIEAVIERCEESSAWDVREALEKADL